MYRCIFVKVSVMFLPITRFHREIAHPRDKRPDQAGLHILRYLPSPFILVLSPLFYSSMQYAITLGPLPRSQTNIHPWSTPEVAR